MSAETTRIKSLEAIAVFLVANSDEWKNHGIEAVYMPAAEQAAAYVNATDVERFPGLLITGLLSKERLTCCDLQGGLVLRTDGNWWCRHFESTIDEWPGIKGWQTVLEQTATSGIGSCAIGESNAISMKTAGHSLHIGKHDAAGCGIVKAEMVSDSIETSTATLQQLEGALSAFRAALRSLHAELRKGAINQEVSADQFAALEQDDATKRGIIWNWLPDADTLTPPRAFAAGP